MPKKISPSEMLKSALLINGNGQVSGIKSENLMTTKYGGIDQCIIIPSVETMIKAHF